MMPRYYHDCINCFFECDYLDFCEMRNCSKKIPEPPLHVIESIRVLRKVKSLRKHTTRKALAEFGEYDA